MRKSWIGGGGISEGGRGREAGACAGCETRRARVARAGRHARSHSRAPPPPHRPHKYIRPEVGVVISQSPFDSELTCDAVS